jgi:hypothetical protein
MGCSRIGVCLGLGLALATACWAVGCGTAVRDEPLELTYYYLPG